MCADNSIVTKTKKQKLGPNQKKSLFYGSNPNASNQEHFPIFRALRGDDLERVWSGRLPIQNTSPSLRLFAGTIWNRMWWQSGTRLIRNTSNSEQLHVFKALCGANPERNAGTTQHAVGGMGRVGRFAEAGGQLEAWKLIIWSQSQWEASKLSMWSQGQWETTFIQISQLLDWLGPEGRVSENKVRCIKFVYTLIVKARKFLQVTKGNQPLHCLV